MEIGKVVEIIGAVIDVQFSRDSIPNIYDALMVEDDILGKTISPASSSVVPFVTDNVIGLLAA